MKERVTIAEAAVLTGRHKSRIYRWIEAHKLQSRTDNHGVLTVSRSDLMRVEASAKSGRPRREVL